jgi:putative transposase
MVHYRRHRVAGGTYFFTVTLADRRSRVLTDYVDVLRGVLRRVRAARPFEIVAMVVLPEHLHAVWTLPEGDADYSGRWRAIKAGFTQELVRRGLPLPRNDKGEYDLWQRRFWEHTVRDETDLARHVDTIHYNPVKHGLVEQVKDWPWSSFHRYVRRGWVAEDWARDSARLEVGPGLHPGYKLGVTGVEMMKIRNMGIVAIALLALVTASGVNAVEYTYDSLNRLTWVKYASGAQITYSYDAAGNLTYISQIAPASVPAAPTLNSVTRGPGSATLNFSPPADTGGSPIASYTATCSANGQTTRTATGTGTPLTVRNLMGGVAYQCMVTATNGGGLSSAASVSLPVTPGRKVSLSPILLLLLD